MSRESDLDERLEIVASCLRRRCPRIEIQLARGSVLLENTVTISVGREAGEYWIYRALYKGGESIEIVWARRLDLADDADHDIDQIGAFLETEEYAKITDNLNRLIEHCLKEALKK